MPDTADWAAQTEALLLDAAVRLAPETGWSPRLVLMAAKATGLTPEEADLLLPRGSRDLAALLSYRHDEQALAALSGLAVANLKIRERIANGVSARVAAALANEPAVRRQAGFLALPHNFALGARLAWESADRIWRWAGDTATDENHYSKRAILAGLITSTLAVRLSNTPAAADQHLRRGIDAVMAYEKAKAKFAGRDVASAAAEVLARLRYGSRASGETPTPA